MSKKTYSLVQGCVNGGVTIVDAIVVFCVENAQAAAGIVAGLGALATVALQICSKFVKE